MTGICGFVYSDGSSCEEDRPCPDHGEVVKPEAVNHPAHYGGEDNPYETIKVLANWLSPEELRGFVKGNAIKYLSRANGKGATQQDHEKAAWYSKMLAELPAFLEKHRWKKP